MLLRQQLLGIIRMIMPSSLEGIREERTQHPLLRQVFVWKEIPMEVVPYKSLHQKESVEDLP